MQAQFLEGPSAEKMLEDLAPVEKSRSSGKVEARPGGGVMEKGRKRSSAHHRIWINFVNANTMHCISFRHSKAHKKLHSY